MPSICRVGDESATHDCFPSSLALTGSTKSFSDGNAVVREGDIWSNHTCPCPDSPHGTHSGIVSLTNTSKSYSGGKKVCRTGDLLSCDDTCGAGSSKTFGGDI